MYVLFLFVFKPINIHFRAFHIVNPESFVFKTQVNEILGYLVSGFTLPKNYQGLILKPGYSKS